MIKIKKIKDGRYMITFIRGWTSFVILESEDIIELYEKLANILGD